MTLGGSPEFPEPHHPNHLEWVGMIANEWSHLEFYIDSTCWKLARIDAEAGACFSANLGSIHMKIRTMYALCELRQVDAHFLKKVRSFQNSVSGTADKRNRTVHDPWFNGISPIDQTGFMVQRVMRADNKGREFSAKVVPIDTLVEIHREILKRVEDFFRLRESLWERLPAF